MKARVCWVYRSGGPMRHGSWVDYRMAQVWVSFCNRKHPELYHFLDLRHGAAA